MFLFHYRTLYHRKNGLRCGVICYIKQKLFTKVIFPSDAIVQTCTIIVETLVYFHLNQPRLVGGLGLCEIGILCFWMQQPPSRLLRGGGNSVHLCYHYIGSGDWVKRHTLVGGLVFIFINLYITWILKLKFRTKRYMGPGETRHKQPQTRCKLRFNEKYQQNQK